MIKLIKVLGFVLGMLVCANAHGDGTHIETIDGNIAITTFKVAHITGSIDEKSAENFAFEMDLSEGLAGDRVILIDSIGGYSMWGQKMIERLQQEKDMGVRVICAVTKGAYSMAFNILTHCSVRLAYPKSTLMFHKLEREFPVSQRHTAELLREFANELDRDDAPYMKANRQALHMSRKDYELFCRNNRQWKGKKLFKMGYLHGLLRK